jgi:Transposase DDE domain group 1
MTDATPLPFVLPAVARKKLTVDFDGGNQSSDAGLLLLRAAEKKVGVCARLGRAMRDRRDPSRIHHAMFELVSARVLAIACGYEDGNDLDQLRHDPALKIAVGRCPETGAALASQSTISRFENAPTKTDAARLAKALVDQFTSQITPAHRDIFDLDDTFDAAHGGQQLTFWNAHHDERGFAPMHVYHAGGGDPAAGQDAERPRSPHRHQASDEAHSESVEKGEHCLAWG